MARFYDLLCITGKWCVLMWRTDEGGLYEWRLRLRSDVSLQQRQLAHRRLQTSYCRRHSQVTWHVAESVRWRHAPCRRLVRSTFRVSYRQSWRSLATFAHFVIVLQCHYDSFTTTFSLPLTLPLTLLLLLFFTFTIYLYLWNISYCIVVVLLWTRWGGPDGIEA